MNISLLQIPKQKQRCTLIERLRQSEKNYNAKLLMLQDKYLRPLQQNRAVLAMSECNRMFCNIEDLIAVSTCLLIRLNDEISQCEEQNREVADVPLGVVFLNMVKPHLEAFSTYSYQFQKDVERTFFRLNQRKQFRSFLTEQEVNAIPLIDLLRLPLSRIGKYNYIFRQLLRCTDEEDADIKNMRTFIQLCSDHTTTIHETILDNNNEQHLKAITERIGGLNFSLVNPLRRYIYEGALMKSYSRGLHYRYFFLFSDMLLYCTGTDCARGDGLKFKDRIFLNGDPMPYTEPIEDDELRQRFNGFHLFTGKAAITLYADTAEEKAYWMNLIEEALHALRHDSTDMNRHKMVAAHHIRSTPLMVEAKKKGAKDVPVIGVVARETPAEMPAEEVASKGDTAHLLSGEETDARPKLPLPSSPTKRVSAGDKESEDLHVKRPKPVKLSDGLREFAGVMPSHSRLSPDVIKRDAGYSSPSYGVVRIRHPQSARLRSKSLEEDGVSNHRRASHRHSRSETLHEGGPFDWLESPRSMQRCNPSPSLTSSLLQRKETTGVQKEKRRVSLDDAPSDLRYYYWAARRSPRYRSPKRRDADTDSEGSNEHSIAEPAVVLGHSSCKDLRALDPVRTPSSATADGKSQQRPLSTEVKAAPVKVTNVPPPPAKRLQRALTSYASSSNMARTEPEFDLGERERPKKMEMSLSEIHVEEPAMIDLTDTAFPASPGEKTRPLSEPAAEFDFTNPFRDISAPLPSPPPLVSLPSASTALPPSAPLTPIRELTPSSRTTPTDNPNISTSFVLGAIASSSSAPAPELTHRDSFASLNALASAHLQHLRSPRTTPPKQPPGFDPSAPPPPVHTALSPRLKRGSMSSGGSDDRSLRQVPRNDPTLSQQPLQISCTDATDKEVQGSGVLDTSISRTSDGPTDSLFVTTALSELGSPVQRVTPSMGSHFSSPTQSSHGQASPREDLT